MSDKPEEYELMDCSLDEVCKEQGISRGKVFNRDNGSHVYSIKAKHNGADVVIGCIAGLVEYSTKYAVFVRPGKNLQETAMLDVIDRSFPTHHLAAARVDKLLDFCRTGKIPSKLTVPYRVWNEQPSERIRTKGESKVVQQYTFHEFYARQLRVERMEGFYDAKQGLHLRLRFTNPSGYESLDIIGNSIRNTVNSDQDRETTTAKADAAGGSIRMRCPTIFSHLKRFYNVPEFGEIIKSGFEGY